MRHRRFEKLMMAFISVGLAMLLWWYVVGQKEGEWSYTVPVTVDVQAEMLTGAATPEKVTVTLRGPQRILDDLQYDKFSVRLVIGDRDPGEYTRNLIPSMVIGVPSTVEILRIEPTEATVRVQELLVRSLPVQIDASLSSELAERYTLEKVAVSPASVDVTGVQESLAGLTRIPTVEVIVEEPSEDGVTPARLLPPPGVEVSPAHVSLSYRTKPIERDAKGEE